MLSHFSASPQVTGVLWCKSVPSASIAVTCLACLFDRL
jgi:hypothetical protein